MANGYIGKISAIVTANTSDLSRKLSGAVGDVDKFANKLNASITRSANAAGASFDKIFTPLQRLERQFSTALKLNLRTEEQVQKLRQLVSVSEQVARPLEKAAANTTKLSAAVAGEFQPALIKSQTQVKLLETAIDRFGSVSEKSFLSVQRRVEQTDAATRRLLEAQSLVSGLATGGELRFQQPALVQQAARAAELQQQASQLSPEQIQGSGIASIVGRQRQATEEAERLLAVLENIRLTRSGDASAAEAAYNKQVVAIRRVNDELANEIALSKQASRALSVVDQPRERRGLGLFGSRAGTEEERAIARARALDAEYRKLPEAAQAGLRGLANIAANVANGVDAGTSNADQLTSVLDRLAPRIREAADAARDLANAQFRPIQGNPTGPFGPLPSDSTDLPPGFLADRAAGAARSFLGTDINDSSRQIDLLGNSVLSLKTQISSLPLSLRTELIPAIKAVEQEFVRLAALGPSATAEEIDNASQKARELERSLKRAVSVSQFSGSFGDFIQDNAADRYLSQLNTIQSQLLAVGATASGPVASAVESYRRALEEAGKAGTLGTADVQRKLDSYIDKIAAAAVATGNFTAAQAKAFAASARGALAGGDVSRFGVDKLQLGLQQAAFAIDDFFSVTGDFQQRLRAISNNITQLGFIVGGTTGLWISLGTVIGAQVVGQIVKWLYQTDLQKAKLKELNDALRSQENAVKSLADAYARLAREIAGAGATGFEARAASRDERIAEIRRAAEERRREDATALSPEVAGIRGERALLEQRLENEGDLRRRIALQNQIDRNRRREQAAVARGVTAPDANAVRDQLIAAEQERVRQTQVRLNRARLRRDLGGEAPPGEDVAALERELRQRQADLAARRGAEAVENRRQQLAQLRGSLSSLEEQRAGVVRSGARTDEIDQAIDDVTTSIRRIEASLSPAVQKVVEKITRGSLSIAATLEETSGIIRNSLGDSVEARRIRRESRASAREVSRLQRAAGNAATPEEATEIRASIARERRRAEDLRRRAQAVQTAAIVDPQSLFGNRLERARSNLQEAGAPQGIIARRSRELEARRAALVQDLDAENPFVRRRAEKALPALDKEVQALEAATLALRRFSEALNAATREAAGNLSSAQQQSDDARRAQLGFDTPRNQARRAQADRDLEEQRQANARVEDAVSIERDRLERQAMGGRGPLAGVFAELESIQEEIDSGNYTAERYAELIAERRRLEEQVTAEAAKGNAVIAARDDSTRIAERQASARRGEELSLTPAERAAEEMARGVADINAYFDQMSQNIIDANNGLPDDNAMKQLRENERKRQEANDRFIEDQERAQAPMVFEMLDAAANVLAQGPRREALGAVDAGTLEGQRELNRLIRGDDPAKDINVIELRKQTAILKDIRDKKVPIAN